MTYIFSQNDWDKVNRLVRQGYTKKEAIDMVDDEIAQLAEDGLDSHEEWDPEDQ